MQDQDPARAPQEPGGGPAPVLRTDLRQNSLVDGAWLVLGLLVLLYYRSQGREQWI